MIRKTRNLFISLAIVAFLVATVIVVNQKGKKPEEPEPSPAPAEQVVLTDIASGALRSLSIENPEGSLTVSSMDGLSWIVRDAPRGYRAKESLLRSLTSNLSAIRGVLIDENPDDPAVYGLESPSAIIMLADTAGNEISVLFGNRNPSENGRYARLKGESRVFIVPSSRANKALWTLVDIREDRLPEINSEAITSIIVRSNSKVFRAVPHSGELDPYRPLGAAMDVIEPWNGRHLLQDHVFQQTMASSPPPNRISSFPDKWTEDPTSLGLNQDADRIFLETADGERYDMEVGVSNGHGRRYAREASYGDVVFLIDKKNLGLLDINPFAHTNQFVFLAGIDRVTEVRIEGPVMSHVLSIEKLGNPEDDSDDVFRIDGVRTSEEDFKKVYQSIIGLLYEGVAQDGIVESEPEYSIRYTHVDPEIPTKTILFRPYNQTYYLAGVQGEREEFIIGRYQVRLMLDVLTESGSI